MMWMLLAIALAGDTAVTAPALDVGIAACTTSAAACSAQRAALRAEFVTALAHVASAGDLDSLLGGPAVMAAQAQNRRRADKACVDGDNAACVRRALDREGNPGGLQRACDRGHALSCVLQVTAAMPPQTKQTLPAKLSARLCDYGVAEFCVVAPVAKGAAPASFARSTQACARGFGAACAVVARARALANDDAAAATARTRACALDPGLRHCDPGVGGAATELSDATIDDNLDPLTLQLANVLLAAANQGDDEAWLVVGELSLDPFGPQRSALDVTQACARGNDLACIDAAFMAFDGDDIPAEPSQLTSKYQQDSHNKRQQMLAVHRPLCDRGVRASCRALARSEGRESERAFYRADCLRDHRDSCALAFDGTAAGLPFLERGCALGDAQSCSYATLTATTPSARRKISDVGCAAGVAAECANAARARLEDEARSGNRGAQRRIVEQCEAGDLSACNIGLDAATADWGEPLVLRLLQPTVGACLARKAPCRVVNQRLQSGPYSVGFYNFLALQSIDTHTSLFRASTQTAAQLRLRVRAVGVLLPTDPRADAADHGELAERWRGQAAVRANVDDCFAGVVKDRCGIVDDACAEWGFADRGRCVAAFAQDGDGVTAPLSARALLERATKEQALACAHAGYADDDRHRTEPLCRR